MSVPGAYLTPPGPAGARSPLETLDPGADLGDARSVHRLARDRRHARAGLRLGHAHEQGARGGVARRHAQALPAPPPALQRPADRGAVRAGRVPSIPTKSSALSSLLPQHDVAPRPLWTRQNGWTSDHAEARITLPSWKAKRRRAAAGGWSNAKATICRPGRPPGQTEAMRDLERARDDAKRAERTARHHLSKFLLRHERKYSGKSWSQKHLEWARRQQFEHEALQRVLVDHLHAVEQATARVERLTKDIAELVESWSLRPLVKALQALRGVQLVTA